MVAIQGPVNLLRNKLLAGQATLCMSVRLARTIEIAVIARACGFDALYVDMAHASMTIETTGQICLAATLAGITPLVRVPHEPSYMGRVLDAGALGLIVPQVDTPEQARRVVAECRFAPRGTRSVSSAGAVQGYAKSAVSSSTAALDAETMVIAMIESVEAVANASEIAAIDGIDMLLVGSNDLTLALGVQEGDVGQKLGAAYETVARACHDGGKIFGVAGIRNDPERISGLLRLGARFFTAGNDEAFILAEGQRQAESFRGLMSQLGTC